MSTGLNEKITEDSGPVGASSDSGEPGAGTPSYDGTGSVEYSPSKGFLLILLAISALAVTAILFFFWYVPTVGLSAIHPALPYAVGVTAASLAFLLVGGMAAVFLAILTGRTIFSSGPLRWALFKIYLPLMLIAGKLVRIPKIKIERAFLDINNGIVLKMRRRIKPGRVLILMPHCIQYEDCKIKVTKDVSNCVSCGKCEIADLLTVMEEFGVELFVSTGGTVARRKVVELRPHAVIAVACERDLISGVRDAYPMPVFGIVNTRPMGYCTSTGVDIGFVKEAVRNFLS